MDETSKPVGWDDGIAILHRMQAAARARMHLRHGQVAFLEMHEWADLHVHSATPDGISLSVGEVGMFLERSMCSGVLAASWDNDLCQSVSYQVGDTLITIETSDWQHFD